MVSTPPFETLNVTLMRTTYDVPWGFALRQAGASASSASHAEFEIAAVEEDSMADKSGIRVGDRLVDIFGAGSIVGITLNELNRRLKTASDVVMTLRRIITDNRVATVSIQRQGPMPLVQGPQPWRVTERQSHVTVENVGPNSGNSAVDYGSPGGGGFPIDSLFGIGSRQQPQRHQSDFMQHQRQQFQFQQNEEQKQQYILQQNLEQQQLLNEPFRQQRFQQQQKQQQHVQPQQQQHQFKQNYTVNNGSNDGINRNGLLNIGVPTTSSSAYYGDGNLCGGRRLEQSTPPRGSYVSAAQAQSDYWYELQRRRAAAEKTVEERPATVVDEETRWENFLLGRGPAPPLPEPRPPRSRTPSQMRYAPPQPEMYASAYATGAALSPRSLHRTISAGRGPTNGEGHYYGGSQPNYSIMTHSSDASILSQSQPSASNGRAFYSTNQRQPRFHSADAGSQDHARSVQPTGAWFRSRQTEMAAPVESTSPPPFSPTTKHNFYVQNSRLIRNSGGGDADHPRYGSAETTADIQQRQFNSPLALYSNKAIRDAFQQTSGFCQSSFTADDPSEIDVQCNCTNGKQQLPTTTTTNDEYERRQLLILEQQIQAADAKRRKQQQQQHRLNQQQLEKEENGYSDSKNNNYKSNNYTNNKNLVSSLSNGQQQVYTDCGYNNNNNNLAKSLSHSQIINNNNGNNNFFSGVNKAQWYQQKAQSLSPRKPRHFGWRAFVNDAERDAECGRSRFGGYSNGARRFWAAKDRYLSEQRPSMLTQSVVSARHSARRGSARQLSPTASLRHLKWKEADSDAPLRL